MAIVLTCHLIETIWSKKESSMRAPFMVIDHNGQQHQTEVMKAGAVTVWNAKATFPYAPSSDLVVMAFNAAGRQPGAFIAQAVVDIAAMLQEGSLNASAALMNRKGQSVGVVLFDVGLVTSSRALAEGLAIPSLTFSTQPCPDSPTAQLRGALSPTQPAAAAANGRGSPFAQLAVQRTFTQQGSDLQPGTPGTAQSMGNKLVGSISQALVGALLGLETRDMEEGEQQASRSNSVSPKRLGNAGSRSLEAGSPSFQAGRRRRHTNSSSSSVGVSAQRGSFKKSASTVGVVSGSSPNNSSPLSRMSLLQQVSSDHVEAPPSPPSAMARSSSSTAVVGGSDRASFSAWRQSGGSNGGPLTTARSMAVSAAGVLPPSAASAAAAALQPQRMAASANGNLMTINTSSSSLQSTSPPLQPAAAGAALPQASNSTTSISRSATAEGHIRPGRLTVPDDAAGAGPDNNGSPSSGLERTLSPLTHARNGLRLSRQQTALPPLAHLFPRQTAGDDLIPVGVAPASPGGYSQATTAGCSPLSAVGHEGTASADYDVLLREFDAADAAGKEQILYRELMLQQQERQAGSNQLLNILTQQQQQEVLEHKQLMDALEAMTSASPGSSPAAARATTDAFRSCFTSSTQISTNSRSSSSGGSTRSGGSFKHYPAVPEGSNAPAAAAGAAATTTTTATITRQQKKGASAAAAAAAAASPAATPTQVAGRPAAGRLLQQLSDDGSDGEPLFSSRQGHNLLGDRVGQQRSAQSSPVCAAAAANAAAAEADAAAAAAAAEAKQRNWQLLQRLRQQEVAATAAVQSYAISHSGTEISDAISEADATNDSPRAASPKHSPSRQAAVIKPAFTCHKAPGQPGGYCATSSDQADTNKGGCRWAAPVNDCVPYAKPLAAFPAAAVVVEPTAPLMTVPEEESFHLSS